MTDRYARIAPVYDALCALGSLGAVGRCKRDALRVVRPGNSVLFAGAGTGEEAFLASETGAHVTVCDLSPAMIGRLQARERGRPARTLSVITGDIRDLAGSHDAVVANFFLNVFAPDDMRAILAHLASLVAPSGRLVIGDVALPVGRISRAFTHAYWSGATRLFRFLTRNAVHPVYDYEAELRRVGFVVENKKTRRLLGAPCFVSSVFVRA